MFAGYPKRGRVFAAERCRTSLDRARTRRGRDGLIEDGHGDYCASTCQSSEGRPRSCFWSCLWFGNALIPHMCVAELTSQVPWRPSTVRRKISHVKYGKPPIANNTTPRMVIGSQCHLLIQTWNLSLRRSGT